MDKELKRNWVNALKSGTFRQVKGRLCKIAKDGKPEFCVLGTLAEVAGVPRVNSGKYGQNFKFSDGKEGYELSDDFCKKVGLPYNQAMKLMDENDSKEKSFAEFAKWIEKNL